VVILGRAQPEGAKVAEAPSPLAMSTLRKKISNFNFLQILCVELHQNVTNALIPSQLFNFVTFKLVKILNSFDFLHLGDPTWHNLAYLWSCKLIMT